jgi:hypothetical protein
MTAGLRTAGERLSIESALPWAMDLLAEGARGDLSPVDHADASVRVVIESERRSFDTAGWELLTRGAWRRDRELVIENACTAGFDMHLTCTRTHADFTFRWRPPTRDRAAARLLRSRFHLLARALMIQYPAMWWAGIRHRVPLHASACTVGRATPLIAAAGGIGRSTLIVQELRAGGRTTGDNIAVGDGTTVWGLVEPLRDRAEALTPDRVIVLERGTGGAPSLVPCSPERAARSLVAATYMAGELRRYWAYAATLSAGTGRGPAHPPVVDVAALLASSLPCYLLSLGDRPEARLSDLLDVVEIAT